MGKQFYNVGSGVQGLDSITDIFESMDKKQLKLFRKEYSPPSSPFQNKPIYNPFQRHWESKPRTSIIGIQQKFASSKALFETEDYLDTEENIHSAEIQGDPLSQQDITHQFKTFESLFCEKSQNNLERNIEDNKQNSSSNRSSRRDLDEPYAFGRLSKLRYPETPIFKKLVKNSFLDFTAEFAYKIEIFNSTKDTQTQTAMIEVTTSPVDFLKRGYKFYMGLGQYFKKLQKIQQALIFYRIALYLQPLDVGLWESITKFYIEIGNHQTGLNLFEVGLLMTKSQTLLEKYIKVLDKQEVKAVQFPKIALLILEICDGKVEKYMKYFIQISKHYYKTMSEEKALCILLYMYNNYQSCGNCLIDIIQLLEIQKQYQIILETLRLFIQNKYVRYPMLYQIYIKFLIQNSDTQTMLSGLELIAQRVDVACVKDSKSRVLFDLAEAYLQIGQTVKYEEYLQKAFQLAKQPFRHRIYFAICSYKNLNPPSIKNIHVILETNKQRFIQGSGTDPILWNFNDWKYYLQYSLFYLFNDHQASYQLLENYAKLKGNSGRIHAELVWIQRVKLQKLGADKLWQQCVVEMPKSGEIWCEGGRILMNKGQVNKARKYFEIAIQLTPQYGDPFIQLLFIYLAQGKYQSIKKLRKKMLFSEPNYGSVWCFLKDNNRSSTIDIWRNGKAQLKCQLYAWNRKLESKIRDGKHLTALNSFNELFFKQRSFITRTEREKLYSLYDQLQ